jgi:GNAT superfamily N-acetyltransferase
VLLISLRSIGPDETHLVSATGDSAEAVVVRDYFDNLLRRGSTQLDWCMLAERDGTRVGSAALYALPGTDVPASIVLIDAPWTDADTAREVVAAVSRRARDLGATELEFALDTPTGPPRFLRHPAEREAAMLAAGFRLLRDGMRWRWTSAQPVPAQDERLVFRALPEVGHEFYVEMLAASFEGTADNWTLDMIATDGPLGAAKKTFDLMMGFDHLDEWYEIAYDADDNPVGVSMPARNPSESVIGEVGVVPAHRRKGYGTAIVARGVAVLAAAGATSIVGDCDSGNPGIIKAFTANGFDNFVNRREFGITFS